MRSVLRLAPVAVLLLLDLPSLVAAPRAAVPSLTIEGDNGSVALALEALRVEVLIRGHLARTTFELTYRNALDHDVDGDFSFPLPPDAEVSDIALYFGRHLRHAVAVERVQARAAYDETVHRGVDPALAEWSASTRSFHFRVYPIPAKGTKLVRIAYDQELTNAPYQLDLRYDTELASVDITIDSEARVESDGVALRRSGGGWAMRGKSVRLNGVIRAGRADSEEALVAFSPRDQTYYASAPLRIRSTAQDAAPASNVLLLVDASASAVQRDAVKLQTFLAAFLANQQRSCNVTIVPFHLGVDAPVRTNSANLEHAFNTIAPAGATNLGELFERLPALVAGLPPDTRIALVSDGINTLGDSRRVARAAENAARLGRPLTVVNASPAADDHFLGRLARTTGGWYFDLTQTDALEAAKAAMRIPMQFPLMAGLPTIRDILPSLLLATTDLMVTVSARSRDRIVMLPVLDGNTRHDVPVRELTSSEELDMVRRAWARARLRSLLDRGAPPAEIVEHGRAFQQLTPHTSLLVLDTWQAYESYGIPIPSEMRAQRDAELAELQAVRVHPNAPGAVVVRAATITRPLAEVPAGSWFVDGLVVLPDGIGLPGVVVTLTMPDGRAATEVTDVDGRFRFVAAATPSSFTIRSEMSGLGTTEQRFSRGAPRGATIEVRMVLATVAESITVTAESPRLTTNSVASTYAYSSGFAEGLLSALEPDAPLFDDRELLAKPLAERLALVSEALAKLASLPSLDDRSRYYLAARSVLGGTKLFQAQAALAVRAESPELAVRWLTDLADAYPDDAPLLRLIGRVLDGWGRGDLARLLFERALELSPRETQTWRELLLLTAKEGRDADLADLRKRYKAYDRDSRMQQTDDALNVELQRVRPGTDPRRDDGSELQIELMWDANYTDVDLHVLEPSGEEVSYQYKKSKSGGLLSADVTAGFGPETYTVPRLASGRYEIALTYYNGDTTRQTMATFAHVIVYVRGERQDFFIPLTSEKERRIVATVER